MTKSATIRGRVTAQTKERFLEALRREDPELTESAWVNREVERYIAKREEVEKDGPGNS